MKLTLRKTLQICREWWDWLAENPDRYKNGWPEKKKYEEIYGEIECDCPCCQYVNQITGFAGCVLFLCPLWALWPYPRKYSIAWNPSARGGNYGCEHQASPYYKWSKSENAESRSRYARQIVEGCDTALAALKGD